jgi:hypothetical protein
MHEKMIGMVKEIQKKVISELNNEKMEREETQESLIRLLEDT